MKFLVLMLFCLGLMTNPVSAQRPKAPDGAKINWDEPKPNSTIEGPVVLKFNAENIEIGSVKNKKSAHFHILIDRPDIVTMLKNDDNYKPGPQLVPEDIHLSNGELEYTLKLPPGPHTIQLLLGDTNHISHFRPVFSELRRITIK